MNRYYRRATQTFRIKLWSVTSVLCFGGVYLGIFTDFTCPASIALALGIYTGVILFQEYFSEPWCSVHPYFQRKIRLPNHKGSTFLNGKRLAMNLDELDELLAASGVRTISSYGFKSSFENALCDWHQPSDGLVTFREGLKIAQHKTELDGVIGELQAIIDILQLAEEKNVKFCLHMRIAGGVSAQEISVREGSYY